MRPLLLAALFLFAPAGRAQTPEDLRALQAVVLDADTFMKTHTLADLVKRSRAWNREADAKKEHKYVVKAIALIVFGHLLDRQVNKTLNSRLHPYFSHYHVRITRLVALTAFHTEAERSALVRFIISNVALEVKRTWVARRGRGARVPAK
jgi:hypothetical protein